MTATDTVAELRACCVDYDKTEMPDDAKPILVNCRKLRLAADTIEAQAKEIERLEKINVGLVKDFNTLLVDKFVQGG